MAGRFKVGEKVRWNSEAGHVSGTIIRVHTRDFDYKGPHASRECRVAAIRDQEWQDGPYRRTQGLGAHQAERLTNSARRSAQGANWR